MRKPLAFLLFIHLFISCSSSEIIDEEIIEQPEIIGCVDENVGNVTEEDNIVINHATDPIVWEGYFTDDEVEISYTKPAGTLDETETFGFIFNKVDECLKVDRAFKFYDGKEFDISAVTQMKVEEFYIKKYEKDELFAGIVVYQDPHDKQFYSQKFWVNLSEKSMTESPKLFSECLEDKLPIDVDMNSDDIVDYQLTFEKTVDVGNTPNYNRYTIKLISTNEDKNEILSPIRNNSPYTVIFEPPFTSENTRQYFNGVKNQLDVFYEFDEPYSNYNYFLGNKLTYFEVLNNAKEDYFLVKMTYNDASYYGWIHFEFNSKDCKVEVKSTFLNPIEDKHVSLN